VDGPVLRLAFRRLASIRLSEVIYFLCLRVRFAAYSARRRTVHFKLNSVHDAIQVIPAESEISTEWVCFHNPDATLRGLMPYPRHHLRSSPRW
jgi:hypothetical protein